MHKIFIIHVNCKSCDNSIQVHSDDETNAINYLKKAHEMAREGTYM